MHEGKCLVQHPPSRAYELWALAKITTVLSARVGYVYLRSIPKYVLAHRSTRALPRPSRWWQGFPYHLELVIALDAGRVVCESMDVQRRKGGPPVNADGLRRIPLASIMS
jgi:hypothetical protein